MHYDAGLHPQKSFLSYPGVPLELAAGLAVEEVEVRGHIIDSLILPKILDCISANGGAFRIKDIAIGQARSDPSHALIDVCADINPSTAIKLADRGTFQTVGLVTDVAPFLRALADDLASIKPD